MGPGTIAASVTDSLLVTILNVPRLEPNGSNWAIFSMRFQEAMQANSKWGHFDGMSARPVPKDANKLEDAKVKAMAKWDHSETIACYMLLQWLPDSTTVWPKNIGATIRLRIGIAIAIKGVLGVW